MVELRRRPFPAAVRHALGLPEDTDEDTVVAEIALLRFYAQRAESDAADRDAAEERMARSVDEFYGGETTPLPVGVAPSEHGWSFTDIRALPYERLETFSNTLGVQRVILWQSDGGVRLFTRTGVHLVPFFMEMVDRSASGYADVVTFPGLGSDGSV